MSCGGQVPWRELRETGPTYFMSLFMWPSLLKGERLFVLVPASLLTLRGLRVLDLIKMISAHNTSERRRLSLET